jgi:uncharacterized protein (TIGR02186 family)
MMTERTCGQSTLGLPRRARVAAIQSMSPWAPCSRNCASRSGACGIESGRVTPTTSKPWARATSASAALRPPPFPPPRAGEGAGRGSYDLVATAIGPRQNLVTRRKARIAGIWVNAESRTFLDVPSYLAVLSTRPLENIADAATLRREQIGLAYAALPQAARGSATEEAFREAFLRIKRDHMLYGENAEGVTFLTPILFRASIFVPAEAQVGSYGVDVKLFADGAVIARSHSAFEIATVGFERFIAGSAVDHGILYGFATAAMALMTGWFASIVFRRD